MIHTRMEYHWTELSAARDTSRQDYLKPAIKPYHRRILDIGCGMGQTLITANLLPEVEAYGIDCDPAAIEAGQRLVPPNIHLSVGDGEHIPFPDQFFDFAICRVALPYMHIRQALAEIHRVLAPGGEAWLLLTSRRLYKLRAIKAVKERNWRDLGICAFVGLNGLLFNATGRQLTSKNRTETFQTESGIRRALTRSGLGSVKFEHREFVFVVECRKPALGESASAASAVEPVVAP